MFSLIICKRKGSWWDKMPEFNGKKVDYNGEVLGIYVPVRGIRTLRFSVITPYDISALEKKARELPNDECIKHVREVLSTAKQQAEDVALSILCSNYDEHKPHLLNTARFFGEVIAALEGD